LPAVLPPLQAQAQPQPRKRNPNGPKISHRAIFG
jgi:hypothetical protein